MIDNLRERYNNNKNFQRTIWDVKIFIELTEKQEIVLKVIYFLENVFKEDLRNILFHSLSDDFFDSTLRKLRDENYIFYGRKKLGTVYALTNKSIQKFEPFNEYYVENKIGDKELFANKIKGGVIAKQLNDYILDFIISEFSNQNSNQIERCIYDQFIKNFRFKDFIRKTIDEKRDELMDLKSLSKEDLDILLKVKNYNDKHFTTYYNVWKSEAKIIQQDKRYLEFRKRFLESINIRNDEARYFLKDFSKEIYDRPWKNILQAFLKEDKPYQGEYIVKQYIKHREYNKIKKREGDQVVYLLELGFSKDEITKYLNLLENDIGRIEMIYEKIKDKDVLQKSSLKSFYDHFYNVINEDKTRFHSEYLSDYKKDKFENIEDVIKKYFKCIDNNYLKDSNRKVMVSLNKSLKGLKYDNFKVRETLTLEKSHIGYELYSYYERSIKKLRNDLLKKQDNELVDEKNKELEKIQDMLKDLKNKITILEDELKFSLLEKEDGEQVERAFTFEILKRNSIFIDKIELEKEIVYQRELGRIKINASVLDNTENGLQPYLIFRRIFIIHTFLTQLIDKEGVLDLHINICTFNENRKQLLENRLIFVKDKMKGQRQGFGNLQNQIGTMNTTAHNLKLWEFYNQIKLEIEEGGKVNEN